MEQQRDDAEHPAGRCRRRLQRRQRHREPGQLRAGGTTTITAQVTNTGNAAATGINVLFELRDPLGNMFAGNQLAMRGQAFGPGETKTYSFVWPSSSSSAQGTYSAAAGVFDQSWATLYAWKTNGQAFTVGTAAQPTFEAGATSTSPGAVARGESLSVTTDVSNTSANPAANIVVDVEIRDAAGTKMLQQYAQGQVFSAGQTKQFVFIFQIPASLPPGTYFVDVAVFNGSWSTLYVYGWHEASFTVN